MQMKAPEPNRSNTLSIAGSLEFTNIDSSSNGYLFTRMQVIETLLNVDPKGQLLPALAKSYHVSNGGKTWLFSPITISNFTMAKLWMPMLLCKV